MIRIPPTVLADVFRFAAVHQTATRFPVRRHHDSGWVQNLSRLRHEPDTAECNDVSLILQGLPRQFQTVAHNIGNLLDLRLLVVVSQQDGAALALKIEDLLGECGGGEHTGLRGGLLSA